MTKGLIDPVETAKRAIQRGDLTPPHVHEGQAHNCSICGVEASFGHLWNVKLPEEAGIARMKPAPPAPKIASPHKQRGDLHRERRAKYLITKKDRPDLFP